MSEDALLVGEHITNIMIKKRIDFLSQPKLQSVDNVSRFSPSYHAFINDPYSIPLIRVERGTVDSIQSISSETEFHHVLIVSGAMRDNDRNPPRATLRLINSLGSLKIRCE